MTYDGFRKGFSDLGVIFLTGLINSFKSGYTTF